MFHPPRSDALPLKCSFWSWTRRRLLRLIAETLERDAHLDFVTPRRDAPARLEDVVRTQVGLLTAHDRTADEAACRDVGPLDQRAVALHAERVHREHQRLLAVVERAEQDLHVVVAEDLIAVGQCRRGLAMQLEGADAEVDRIRGVPHQHLRRVHRRHAVVRGVLRKARQQRRARPRRIAEVAVDHDVGVESWNPHVQLALAARVDSYRVRRGAAEQQTQCQQHVR
jgi:hypothetical protein